MTEKIEKLISLLKSYDCVYTVEYDDKGNIHNVWILNNDVLVIDDVLESSLFSNQIIFRINDYMIHSESKHFLSKIGVFKEIVNKKIVKGSWWSRDKELEEVTYILTLTNEEITEFKNYIYDIVKRDTKSCDCCYCKTITRKDKVKMFK